MFGVPFVIVIDKFFLVCACRVWCWRNSYGDQTEMEQVGGCASNSFPDVMGDPESLEKKIAAIRAAGPQKLQVFSCIFSDYSRTSVFCSPFLLFHFRNIDRLQCLRFSMLEIT